MHALSIATIALLSAAVTAPAAGYVVPRKETPSTYAVGYLEDYQTYHTRYLAIGCQYQHNNATFFNACCHPMLATETLETARPSYCIPSTSASASASAAEATSTVTALADGDNGDGDDSDDCDDGDDDESASSSAAFATSETPSPTGETFSTTSSSEFSEPTTFSDFTPTSTSTPTSTPEVAQATSSSSAETTSTSGSVDVSDSSSQDFTGGQATYFYQNGVAGACGTVHSDSDFIVAIDSELYGNTGAVSEYCGKTVAITGLGKTMQATVADACPTCDNKYSLDMSVGLFKSFTDLSVGEFDMTWSFV